LGESGSEEEGSIAGTSTNWELDGESVVVMAADTLWDSVIVFDDLADLVIGNVLNVHLDSSAVVTTAAWEPITQLTDSGVNLIEDRFTLVHNEVWVSSAASEAETIAIKTQVGL